MNKPNEDKKYCKAHMLYKKYLNKTVSAQHTRFLEEDVNTCSEHFKTQKQKMNSLCNIAFCFLNPLFRVELTNEQR